MGNVARYDGLTLRKSAGVIARKTSDECEDCCPTICNMDTADNLEIEFDNNMNNCGANTICNEIIGETFELAYVAGVSEWRYWDEEHWGPGSMTLFVIALCPAGTSDIRVWAGAYDSGTSLYYCCFYAQVSCEVFPQTLNNELTECSAPPTVGECEQEVGEDGDCEVRVAA